MIGALLVMATISFGFRYAPFVLSKWLQRWSFLEKLAATVPACILILLVAHNLENTGCGIAEMGGLIAVIVMQLTFRSILTSMLLGVAVHQLLMHLL